MSKPLLTELFEKPNTEFSKHINDPQNVRILFSGKFGIGKTTFINQYFAGKEDEYVKIHLYPVNYSIASNEDIIDLIKYDILMELIRKGATFFETEIPKENLLYGFSETNALEIVKIFVNCIPKAGKDIASVIKELENLHKSFQKYCAEAIDDEGKKAFEFLKKVQNGKGSIYEQTAVTSLIKEKIDFLKQNGDTPKKIVLVIDDLDRIDPDHIFRLFNVFAAQFDSTDGDSSSNKFGFDKVMFVCDVDNIRSIFKHKYGAETDFGGYIDKFYSKEVFVFDNIYNYDEITRILTNKIVRNYTSINPIQDSEPIKNIVSIFIKICVEQRLINLRVLCRYIDKEIIIEKVKKVWVARNKNDVDINWGIYISTLIIRKMFGNDDVLESLLKRNKNRTDVNGCLGDVNYILNQNAGPLINLSQNKVYSQPPYNIHIDDNPITIFNSLGKDLRPKITGLKINSFAVFYEVLKFIKDLEANDYKILANSPVYEPPVKELV